MNPSESVKQNPYLQSRFLDLKIPMFAIETFENIYFIDISEVQGVEDFLRQLQLLYFEILRFDFAKGLTSAAASGIGACAATLLLPASD